MPIRHEKIDVRALLNGDPGDANYTDPKLRMTEREKVLAYWPDDLIVPVRDGYMEPPPWRFYLDPTGWTDRSSAEVADYVRDYVRERSRWPSIDTLHRRFGRVTNHRGADEVPEQVSLL